MKAEYSESYKRGCGFNWIETFNNKMEVSAQDVKKFWVFLEMAGFKRYENKTQIWFEKVISSNELQVYTYWKED